MSRTRREKEPNKSCGFQWEPVNVKTALVDCPHLCNLPLDHSEDEHFCCHSLDGKHSI